MKAQSLALLHNNADLLSTDKQAVARWLCEVWASAPSPAPKWLQHRYWTTFSFPLHTDDAPEKMLRELSLELLEKHKVEIARRMETTR